MLLLLMSSMILAVAPASICKHKPDENLKIILEILSSHSTSLQKTDYIEDVSPLATGLNICQDEFFCKAQKILEEKKPKKMEEVTRNLKKFNEKQKFKCDKSKHSTGNKIQFSEFVDHLENCSRYYNTRCHNLKAHDQTTVMSPVFNSTASP